MSDIIINKVAESGIISLDLETYLPKTEIKVFDIKQYLFMELILKEKDFRISLQGLDWSEYRDQYVAVTCTADAIIPVWAYMLIATYLQPIAKEVHFGTAESFFQQLFIRTINEIDPEEFSDKRIVVKGCGDAEVGPFAYMEITKKLRPVAKSIMYGEPCSTVPVYKKKA